MDLFNRKQEPLNKLKKQVFNNETEYVQALASKLKEDI
jgi:hypothetical protein